MYDAERLNSRALFQRTSHFMNLGIESRPTARRLSLVNGTVILLNRADAVVYHLDRIHEIEYQLQKTLKRCTAGFKIESGQVMVFAPQVNEIVFELVAVIVNFNLTMNAVLQLWFRKKNAHDTPSSMRKAIKSLRKGSDAAWCGLLTDNFKKRLIRLWESYGERLSDYRDIDQHYDVLARQCVTSFNGGLPGEIDVLLPDNPGAKSPGKFRFEEKIHGVRLAEQAFEALHGFTERHIAPSRAKPRPLPEGFISAKPAIHADKQPRATLALGMARRSGYPLVRFLQSSEQTVIIERRTRP